MKIIINTVTALVILFALCSTSVFAAVTETPITNYNDNEIYNNLTQEQKNHFLYNHLSIQIEEKSQTYSNFNSYSYPPIFYPVDYGFQSGMLIGAALAGATANAFSETNKSIDWVPYCGPEKISKLSFFHMVGAYELEEDLKNKINIFNSQYEEYAKKRRSLDIAGYSLLGIGTAAMLSSSILFAVYACNSSLNSNLSTSSLILLGVGSLFTLASLFPLLISIPIPKMEESNVSISLAFGLANDYNHKLLTSYN